MLRHIAVAILYGLCAFGAAIATAAAQPPLDPTARAAFMEADRAALLDRIHPRWRDFQPVWREEVCPFGRVAEYDPERVSCGYVLVPENRRDPESRLIRIAVSKVKSIAKGAPPAGATVYLSGGPGGPAAEGAANMFPDQVERHRAFLELSDFYFVDQRGVGFSDAPLCRGLRGVNDIPVSLESGRMAAGRIRACLEEARTRGIDPDAYTTWDNALDIRDIRRALQLERWNIFGVSYGTELGQMILRVDGDGVRAAVLDSVVAPKTDGGGWRLRSEGFVSAIGKLNEACAADPACAARYGDLEALARRVVEAYDAAPYTIEGLDPEVFQDGELMVNGAVIAGAVFQALYADEFYPSIPPLLEALAERRADAALSAYVDVLAPADGHDWGRGMHFVASCAGSATPHPERIALQAQRQPFWSNAFLESAELERCDLIGRPPADPLDASTPLITDRPVLLLAGGVDPITPPYMAEAVKAGLPGAVYVLAPWVGHGVARSDDCVGVKIMPAFLANPTQTPDTACLAEMTPPDIIVDYTHTDGPFGLYQAYEDGQIAAAAAWLGASALALLAGLLAFPMGVVARAIDQRPVIGAGWARRTAWGAALLSLVGLGLVAASVMQTMQSHLLLAPLGLAGPAAIGGWLILAGAVAGLVAIALVVLAMIRRGPPIGTILGVLITGLAALALAAFALAHGLA